MKEFVVEKQISIQATPRQVWLALTNPELTQKYFFGCKVYSRWRVDDPIVFKRRILWIFPMELRGKIIRINHGSLLQYSLRNSRSASESNVTINCKKKVARQLYQLRMMLVREKAPGIVMNGRWKDGRRF